MKITAYLSLLFFLAKSFALAQVADTPTQAAARLALENKLHELELPPTNQSVTTPAPPPTPTALPVAIVPLAPSTPVTTTTVIPVATPVAAAVTPMITQPTPTLRPIVIQPQSIPAPAATPPPVVSRSTPVLKPVVIRATGGKNLTPTNPRPDDDTIDLYVYGRHYPNAEVMKADQHGVLISYWNDQGGLEMSWFEYKDLPGSIRNKYMPAKLNPDNESASPATGDSSK